MHTHKDMFRSMHVHTVYMRMRSTLHRILTGRANNIYEIYCDFFFFCLNKFIHVSFVLSTLSAAWVLIFLFWKCEILQSMGVRDVRWVCVSGVSLTVVCSRMEKRVKVGKRGQVSMVGCLWQRGRAECHHDLANRKRELNRAKREKMRVLGGVGSELKGRGGLFSVP